MLLCQIKRIILQNWKGKNDHTNQMQAIHLRTDSMDMEQTKGVTSNLNGKRN